MPMINSAGPVHDDVVDRAPARTYGGANSRACGQESEGVGRAS
jgi:hypothetical protein